MKDSSNDLQKLLKSFNETAIAFHNTPLLAGFSKILYLYLKDDELAVLKLLGFPASILADLSLLK